MDKIPCILKYIVFPYINFISGKKLQIFNINYASSKTRRYFNLSKKTNEKRQTLKKTNIITSRVCVNTVIRGDYIIQYNLQLSSCCMDIQQPDIYLFGT